jgi:integrase
VYKRKDGRWVGQYKDVHGKLRYLYRKAKAEAQKALQEALRDKEEGIVSPHKMTVGMYLDEWLADRRDTISRRTWINQESLIRCHVKPYVGSQKLANLIGKDLTRLYRQKLADELAASTVGQLHRTLKHAMKDAVRSKYIRTNPLDDVKPPGVEAKEFDVLSKEQVLYLLDTVKGTKFERVFILGALVGLRIGECLSLRWDSVDIANGGLQVRHTVWRNTVSQPIASGKLWVEHEGGVLDPEA